MRERLIAHALNGKHAQILHINQPAILCTFCYWRLQAAVYILTGHREQQDKEDFFTFSVATCNLQYPNVTNHLYRGGERECPLVQLHTSAHKVSTLSIPEVMEHLVSMRLVHLGMDKETRIPKLGDLLSQQLHSLYRVAEDDALVDLELGE